MLAGEESRNTPTAHATAQATPRLSSKQVVVNSLSSVEPEVLLAAHLVRLRLVRQWWRQRSVLRTLRCKARLEALGVPIDDAGNTIIDDA